MNNDAIQEIYRQCLARVAPLENARMRQRMGHNTADDAHQLMEQEVIRVLERLGEATVDDLCRRLKLRKPAVQGHLTRLLREGVVQAEDMGRGLPTVWSLTTRR